MHIHRVAEDQGRKKKTVHRIVLQICLHCCHTFAWAPRDHSVQRHEQKSEKLLPSCRDVKVVGIEKFGLFVEFLPSRPGLLHTSELANNEDLNDFDINDIIDVMLLAVSLLNSSALACMKSSHPMPRNGLNFWDQLFHVVPCNLPGQGQTESHCSLRRVAVVWQVDAQKFKLSRTFLNGDGPRKGDTTPVERSTFQRPAPGTICRYSSLAFHPASSVARLG